MSVLSLSVPEIALDQVFCGAGWNRTIGLSIIRAGQGAGQAIGIGSDVPFRATTSHHKTARATSFGHALGTEAPYPVLIGTGGSRLVSAGFARAACRSKTCAQSLQERRPVC